MTKLRKGSSLSRPERRAEKKLQQATNMYNTACALSKDGGKGYTKPGANKHW